MLFHLVLKNTIEKNRFLIHFKKLTDMMCLFFEKHTKNAAFRT